MPDLLEEFPQDDTSANNNPAEVSSEAIEAELWRCLRAANLDRFREIMSTIKTGTTTLELQFELEFGYKSYWLWLL